MRKSVLAGLIAAVLVSVLSWADGINIPFSFPATACTNQFVRSLAAATGAGTCASIAAGDFPALTGDVTTAGGSLSTTLAAGSASNLNSGTLAAARMPALTGDCTTSAGAVATTCLNTAWSTYTPTASCAGGTITSNTTLAGRYKIVGKVVFIQIAHQVATLGTCTGNVAYSTPGTVNTTGSIYALAAVNTSTNVSLAAYTFGGSNQIILPFATAISAAQGYNLGGLYELN